MSVQFHERPNNTREQVESYLADAAQLVTELDLPDELREMAFSKAVDLFASKQIVGEQVAPAMAIPRNMGRH